MNSDAELLNLMSFEGARGSFQNISKEERRKQQLQSISVSKEGLKLDEFDDEKEKREDLNAKIEPLCKSMKEILGDRVQKVIVFDKVDSPCLVTNEYGWTAKMERIMKAESLPLPPLLINSLTSAAGGESLGFFVPGTLSLTGLLQEPFFPNNNVADPIISNDGLDQMQTTMETFVVDETSINSYIYHRLLGHDDGNKNYKDYARDLLETLIVQGEERVEWSAALGEQYPLKSISSHSSMDDVYRFEKMLGGLVAADGQENIIADYIVEGWVAEKERIDADKNKSSQ
ncbi:hypothetical protein SUGI_0905700 [Cryptomeria japonica]|nr:hypothetical protein SUGI_0905700 [Cryptomeria japonica]